MKSLLIVASALLLLTVWSSTASFGQNGYVDAKGGLSIWSGGGSSTALLLGAGVDLPYESIYIRPEFNLTTFSGTPIELAGIIKYEVSKSPQNTFYIDGGLGIWFYSGGPYLGLNVGGGAIFPLSGSKLAIPVDLRMGPIFGSGATAFQFTITSGVRIPIGQ